jgi:prephenate dehydrogenase
VRHKTSAVIGTGLIGGSVAAGLRSNGWTVTGFDPDTDAANAALDLGLVDHIASTVTEAIAGADLVVVAAPPKATIEVIANLSTDAVVMDVAGVKAAVAAAADHLPLFVATHPMAGREVSGPQASSAALFSGASWVVIEGADPRAMEVVSEVIESLGARQIVMSAEAHDRSVALISHLPQLVATGLLTAAAGDPASLDLAAGSFRDLTRVGASQPMPWVEIIKTNHDAVLHAIGSLREGLAALEAAIMSDDDSLLAILSAARTTRQGLGSPVTQVRIALADRPGELARVGHAFEASGVDIRDIQMRHAPHGGGGVLTLSVRPGEEGALRLALENESLLIVP